jgi:hypothetical protein
VIIKQLWRDCGGLVHHVVRTASHKYVWFDPACVKYYAYKNAAKREWVGQECKYVTCLECLELHPHHRSR